MRISLEFEKSGNFLGTDFDQICTQALYWLCKISMSTATHLTIRAERGATWLSNRFSSPSNIKAPSKGSRPSGVETISPMQSRIHHPQLDFKCITIIKINNSSAKMNTYLISSCSSIIPAIPKAVATNLSFQKLHTPLGQSSKLVNLPEQVLLGQGIKFHGNFRDRGQLVTCQAGPSGRGSTSSTNVNVPQSREESVKTGPSLF